MDRTRKGVRGAHYDDEVIVNLSSDAGPQIKNALTVSSLFLLFLIIRRWGVVVRLYVLLRHSATCIVDSSLKPYGNDCCGCYGGYGYQGGAGDCGAGCCDSDFYCPCCACCDTRYRRGGGSLLLLLLLLHIAKAVNDASCGVVMDSIGLGDLEAWSHHRIRPRLLRIASALSLSLSHLYFDS